MNPLPHPPLIVYPARIPLILLVLLFAISSLSRASAQLISNGSFEQGSAITGTLLTVTAGETSLTGWTVASNDLEVVTNGEWPAAHGDRSIDLNGVTNATLFQDVSGLIPGRNYLLSFSLSGNPFTGGDTVGETDYLKNLRVTAGPVTADFAFDVTPYHHPSGSTPPAMGWRTENVVFTAAAATQRIQFASLDPGNSTRGPALDNVSLVLIQRPVLTVRASGGTPLATGASVPLGAAPVGTGINPVSITIGNDGDAALNLASISLESGNTGDFTLSPVGTSNVPPGATTSFTANFTPGAAGARDVVVKITNNAPGDPFRFHLSGTGLSPSADTDQDGLNDVAEFKLSALGFNWQTPQVALVAALYDGAPSADLYRSSELQALHPGTPLIFADPATGRIRLKTDWKRSIDLLHFADFPAPPESTLFFDAAGDVIFEFTPEGNRAFFRIECE